MTEPDHPALDDATAMLNAMILAHKSAAIPNIICACVMWALDNGGADVIRVTLVRGVALVDEMDAIRLRLSQ